MIYFRTPETVYLLQTSYTNHNYPFYLPTNPDLSFIYTSELYHKAGNAKSPNSFLSGLFRYAQIDLILFGFPALDHTLRKPLPSLTPD